MIMGIKLILVVILILLILGVVIVLVLQNKEENPNSKLPNPASVYCEEQGHDLEIRADEEGNQYGVCIFPDGSECEEWKYYRGECKIGDSLK